MVGCNALQKFLTERDIQYFTFYTKADKSVKAVTSHFVGYISAQDITVALQEIDYDISVKQMTAKRPLWCGREHRHHECPQKQN
jgi:hypothetical protein